MNLWQPERISSCWTWEASLHKSRPKWFCSISWNLEILPCSACPKGDFGSAFQNRFPPWLCAMARQLPWHFDTARRGEAGTQTPFPLRKWIRQTQEAIDSTRIHAYTPQKEHFLIVLICQGGFLNWEPTKPIHFTLRPVEMTRYSSQNLEISFNLTKKCSKVFRKVIVFDGNLPNPSSATDQA